MPGAQLIARAFGGRVYQHEIPELGFTPLFSVAGAEEPWLQDYPPGMPMMQWHFDTFDLPVGAKLLLTNAWYDQVVAAAQTQSLVNTAGDHKS